MNISTFISQYKRMVFCLAGRIAKKFAYKVEKEDLSQEGFLELVRLYESGKIDWKNPGLTNFLWKRVEGRMKNVAINAIRETETVIPMSGIAEGNTESVQNLDDVTSAEQASETNPEKRDLLRRIGEYLDSLPTEARFIFISYRIDCMSFEKIGLLLKISRETVRRRFRAVESEMYVFLEINPMGGE